ncbi:hypothetical protein [Limimaricola pyoseonensis]|uniref:hypothetical protein n=1 Tax=Limimaricola pyoseonensis TaxID=521013 RepID=UPI0013F4D898|nr:hypothetical protein [Limimaricola pyoseonensis]
MPAKPVAGGPIASVTPAQAAGTPWPNLDLLDVPVLGFTPSTERDAAPGIRDIR